MLESLLGKVIDSSDQEARLAAGELMRIDKVLTLLHPPRREEPQNEAPFIDPASIRRPEGI